MRRLHNQIQPFQSGAQTDKNLKKQNFENLHPENLFYISRFWFVIYPDFAHLRSP